MDKLLAYLNGLAPDDREAYAKHCDTTVGYLRKACSIKQQLSEGMCLRLSIESGGKLRPDDIRPDLDWQYLSQALASTAQAATETVALQEI